MEAARAFLEMHRRDGDQLFSPIVTGDESWMHHSTPETKRQSMVWKKPEESAPKKAKVTISAGKVMATFWDCKGVLLVDYLPPNTTVNAARYCEVLTKLRAAIKRKRPGLLSRKVLLVHDNARPHAARTTQTLLESFKLEIFIHPPYSPDLAPSDFYLFPALKLHLGGRHFANDDEVQAEANHWLRRQDTAWNNSGIKLLLQRFQKCLDRNGDYVENGLGYIVGSSVSKLFDNTWYWALRVTPFLGIVLTILTLFFLKDPPRGEADGSTEDGAKLVPTSFLQDLRELSINKSFMWSTIGFTCVAFAIGSLAWWAPTFMINALNLSQAHADEQTVTLVFGAITCFGGILGILIGSQMSSYLKKRLNTPRCDPLICAVSLMAGVPLLFLSCTFASRWPNGSWVLMFLAVTSLCCNWSIISDIVMVVFLNLQPQNHIIDYIGSSIDKLYSSPADTINKLYKLDTLK
ncbi:hypothetical protein LAZ67_3001662 [Cordylochernes scorpioides]|uniref:Uncharacterized protein n=1 Tax=Cordylochernes scorpioides TaxID=51811 RepID=A0ABY6K743_9ARAC|nr:hypothetical protein LAZ67_3001662 [Cordylochernes scorpioides]